VANASSPIAPTAFTNEVVAVDDDVPTEAALLLVDLSLPVPSVVVDLTAPEVATDLSTLPTSDVVPANASTLPTSDVVPANANESSPQALHPLASAITPLTSRLPKRSGASRLTDRTHNILDDARILGFLREPFTKLLKASGKTMISFPCQCTWFLDCISLP
jgi:hypothetical protein